MSGRSGVRYESSKTLAAKESMSAPFSLVRRCPAVEKLPESPITLNYGTYPKL